MKKNSPKLPEGFYCKKCDYKCKHKGDWNKHILTQKHVSVTKCKKNSPYHNCECGKKYKFLSGLTKHKLKCKLQKNNNIGITGYYQKNDSIYPLLTQTFVSKKHMDIFGFYFPEQLKNWYCDDWINQVYKKTGRLFPILDSNIINKQTNQTARYTIPELQITRVNLKKVCNYLVNQNIQVLKKYLEKNK